MSRYIDADFILDGIKSDRVLIKDGKMDNYKEHYLAFLEKCVELTPSIDIVRCQDCKKSHIDGKTTHYLWCTEWGRSTDTFGYCERGEREGERCHTKMITKYGLKSRL